MSFAEKLEKLARLIPGVTGYQDRESSRETDKTVRLRLSQEMEQMKRDLERLKEHFMEQKDLGYLPALDRASSKLDKLANLIKYAGRGYRGLFDVYKLDQKRLDALYGFDLNLLNEIQQVKDQIHHLGGAQSNGPALKSALSEMDRALDGLEKIFHSRQQLLTNPIPK
jgi:hypothetical protein